MPWTTAPRNALHVMSPPAFPAIDDLHNSRQQQQNQQKEEAALSVSDQRTLYLVNIFIVDTTCFLNSFSALCEAKLVDVHRRMLRLDSSLTLLEEQLRSGSRFEETVGHCVRKFYRKNPDQNEVEDCGLINLDKLCIPALELVTAGESFPWAIIFHFLGGNDWDSFAGSVIDDRCWQSFHMAYLDPNSLGGKRL
ncbi:hypothetical protein NE237_006591 [Protea cynaroides]|uniref:Uncharacterized protein n=1 Tax=Protea cynaroides TaxID=273540 RepID=A0A9Q0KMN5_9MAGN|nr:hypothetical protein NE237_006591 [Protea cynaroides]